ncbi:MAG: hypothetical protein IT420_07215 [Candidatus Brocadia sp.]|nr:hypothetical protein [Candidatus Brocadia sp.]
MEDRDLCGYGLHDAYLQCAHLRNAILVNTDLQNATPNGAQVFEISA